MRKTVPFILSTTIMYERLGSDHYSGVFYAIRGSGSRDDVCQGDSDKVSQKGNYPIHPSYHAQETKSSSLQV